MLQRVWLFSKPTLGSVSSLRPPKTVLIERESVQSIPEESRQEKLIELVEEYELPLMPVRHHRFKNWYRYEEEENGLGQVQT